MKTKLISEDGKVTIQLTPENDFETDIIEKVKHPHLGLSHDIVTEFNADYDAFSVNKMKNHRIELKLKDLKTKK